MLLAYLSNISEIQLKYSFYIAPRFCKPAPLKYWVLQVEVFMDTERTAEHKLHWKHPMASGTQAVALLPAAARDPLPRLYRTLQIPDLHHPARSHLECTLRCQCVIWLSAWGWPVWLPVPSQGSTAPAQSVPGSGTAGPCSGCSPGASCSQVFPASPRTVNPSW